MTYRREAHFVKRISVPVFSALRFTNDERRGLCSVGCR